MPWTAYQVILRLHTPLHIGAGRVSYLQRARPYVTGRALRGALVSRVARLHNETGENAGDPYRAASKTFAQFMAFTYFYPALNESGEWKPHFPWEDEARFRRRFLSSSLTAALEYPRQTAAEGLLYETEFLSPHTLDDGQPVHLMGCIFVQKDRLRTEKYDWKRALCRLTLGGERGYGWGEARLVENGLRHIEEETLFGGKIRLVLGEHRPVVCLDAGEKVLAHTLAACAPLSGQIEPMVGREWRADNQEKKKKDRIHVGQHLAYNGLYYAPGSLTRQQARFVIGEGGYWL